MRVTCDYMRLNIGYPFLTHTHSKEKRKRKVRGTDIIQLTASGKIDRVYGNVANVWIQAKFHTQKLTCKC